MDMNNSRSHSRDADKIDTPFYVGLISAVLKDAAIISNQTDTELARDLQEIEARTRSEGISFLTRTLPSLAKSMDNALAMSTCLDFKGFKSDEVVKLPRFMRSYFEQVFDEFGWERSDASPLAIKCIRQVLYLFYKLNLPPTEEQCNEVVDLFIRTDKSLSFDSLKTSPYEKWVIRYARGLICRVLGGVSPLDPVLFRPRHGPGAVATGEKANEKPCFKRYFRRLAKIFPYDKYFFFNLSHLSDRLSEFYSMEELESGTAKVVLVPKDSRGPRLISCEPLENQWIQQGLMNVLVKTIERHPLTKGLVNFTDQTVNQRLALESSLSGRLVTLDMKEASDRVSLELVKALFPTTWFDALYACRSEATLLPDGTVMPLKKFAPMGSAVCFPVEALVFWALSVSCIAYYEDSAKGRKAIRQSIYVYGDDIICGTKDHEFLMRKLPMFDLEFNKGKCCTGRFFRESCGVDAYKGVDVTPLKVRAVWCSSLAGMDYVSWVAYHNAFEKRGFYTVCDYLSERIQDIRLTPYADLEGSEVVALIDSRKTAIHANHQLGIKSRMHGSTDIRKTEYQCYEVKAWVVFSRVLKDTTVPGWSEMLRVASYTWSENSTRMEQAAKSALRPRLAPGGSLSSSDAMKIVRESEGPLVTAYQYTLPRQVTLRRGWGRLNIYRR